MPALGRSGVVVHGGQQRWLIEMDLAFHSAAFAKSPMTTGRNDLASESRSTLLKDRVDSRDQVIPPERDLL